MRAGPATVNAARWGALIGTHDPNAPAPSALLPRPPRERFHQGTILRVSRGSFDGWLRSASGRELPFTGRDVVVLGAARTASALRPGMQVGFDVGRTAHGLRVTTIRVYAGDEPETS